MRAVEERPNGEGEGGVEGRSRWTEAMEMMGEEIDRWVIERMRERGSSLEVKSRGGRECRGLPDHVLNALPLRRL